MGCDALQVYRGLDAATAKPSAEARRRVPHHLVDVADPREAFSLATYVREADAAIEAIVGRGRVPVVVGGTGMYLRGLLAGIVATPPRDAALRERLHGIAARRGSAPLHRWLERLDPGSARRLMPSDTQRIVRALELALEGSGSWSERLAEGGTWGRGVERYAALKFGVDRPREGLAARLAARVDAFFAAGLVEEVRALLAAGVPREANALKAIGYREVADAIARGDDPAAVRDAVVAATRRYAKRQRTWFRKEPGLTWLDASEGPDALAAAIAAIWRGSGETGAP